MPQLSSLVFIHLTENGKTEEEAKAIISDVNKIFPFVRNNNRLIVNENFIFLHYDS